MSEDKQYRIIFEENQKESLSSRDFTGKGKAFYINDDQYDGEYVEGMRDG